MHNLIGYRTTLSFYFCQSVITLCIGIPTSRIETVLPTMNYLLLKKFCKNATYCQDAIWYFDSKISCKLFRSLGKSDETPYKALFCTL